MDLFQLDIWTLIGCVLVLVLLFILSILGFNVYQKIASSGRFKHRRRRYTLYDDSNISYNMRTPLIRSASFRLKNLKINSGFMIVE